MFLVIIGLEAVRAEEIVQTRSTPGNREITSVHGKIYLSLLHATFFKQAAKVGFQHVP